MASEPLFERWGDSGAEPLRITVRPPTAATEPTFERWGGALDDAMKTAGGLAKSLDAGVAEGVAGIGGLPNAVAELGAAGIDKATEYISGLLGTEYKRPTVPNSPLKGALPTTAEVQKSIERDYYGGQPLYESQGRGERYARTIGNFLPGAIGPGGVIGNAVKFGVLPGAASEFAGEQLKDTGFEQVGRVGAGLLTGGLAAAASRPGTAAQAIRRDLPPGITEQMVNDAHALMLRSRAGPNPVPLVWSEALSQVSGRPVLSDMARHLEAPGPTQGRMAEFYGERPQQVEQAVRGEMNAIAPPNMNPHGIGHAAGEVVEGAVHDARGAINRTAAPHYQASEGVLLNSQEMAQVQAIPGYAQAAAAVRNEPQLNRYVAHLPDNSVGFLNEVKKQLDHSARNAAAPMGPQGIPNQQIAAGFRSDAATARQTGINATGGPTGPYATALGIEEQGRSALDRLLQGPMGKIASKDTTTRQAIEALFPREPLANSEQSIALAVGTLANRSPRIAGDLVRAHAEEVFNESMRAMGGQSQTAGAKFAKELVGNPQQRANLEAATTALPHGADRWAGFNRLLEVLEATGTRQNVGSKTAYNAEFLKEASSSGIIGEVAKGAANPITKFTAGLIEKFERYKLGGHQNELADILTNPAAVGQLRAIARMPPNSPQAAAVAWRLTNLVRSGSSSGQPVQQPRQ